MKNCALVVIDLQNDITKNYREIIEKVNAAIDRAVQEELLIVYIRHNNLSDGTRTFKPGTRGAEFVPELKVVSDYRHRQIPIYGGKDAKHKSTDRLLRAGL